MQKKKSAPLSLILLLIIAMLTACSPAGKTDSAGSQADAVSSGDASAEENPGESKAGGAGSETDSGENAEKDFAVSETGEGASDTLQDGTYVPTTFTVQGGTGKVSITCPEVVIADGGAQALLEFSSPHYEWVKVDGVQYDPENSGEADRKNSVFRIPAVLDQEMPISGLTTAMSEPHEIEYTLFISLTQKDESAEEGASEDKTAEIGSVEGTADKSASDAGSVEGTADKSASDAGSVEGTADKSASDAGSVEGTTDKSAAAAGSGEGTADGEDAPAAGSDSSRQGNAAQPPEIDGLTYVSSMEKVYAETFDIHSYKLDDGSSDALYHLIDVHDSAQYLILPEKSAAGSSAAQEKLEKNLPGQITVLQAPLDNFYVAATSSMALFDAAGAIGQVKLTGTKADGWYIDAPKKALADGSMIYAGKYSAPDYELLASSGCCLAVESMMILHSPEVKEKLEELGIPVFIDTSSNESHPMGRTEWVRLYGVLTGHEKDAEAFFEEQKKHFAQTDAYTDTGLTVAFFSISSSGNVIVRATDDYIPRMIELAGGKYIFEELLNESGNSASVRLSMEDFYSTAKDADFLIYNATIENPVKSIDQLCGRSALLLDFKAVQEGNVWQVQRSLYQSPDIAARMITDLHGMLTAGNKAEMTFLEQLE